ncbi:MAG TPA: hypothetical protein VJ960_00380, partial [Oceanipulchritudo sp.]|nr:hypothetical protein [Oceanipulchritudo sp.]
MNCHPPRFRLLVPALGLSLAAPLLFGQSPQYVPPPPPTKHITFELRARFLMKPDITFQGLGSIPLRDSYATDGNLILGTERSIEYDDGFLSQDYIQTTLVEGRGEGQQVIPSPNSDATSNFGYINDAQVDGNALVFHRYASMSDPAAELSGSTSGSLGWELNYTKFINPRRNIGIQVGFSFNGFDSRFSDSISADLYVQEFRHEMADGAAVPELPTTEDADGNIVQQPYEGDVLREDVESGDLLEWIASEESESLLADGATVDTTADLRTSMYNFRAGPTYNLSLGQAFALQVGAGVSAVYFAGQFSAYEILQNPGGGENPSRGLITTDSAEWQLGGYLDASAQYLFTERVSLFSGMQVQSGSNYSQENEDRHANVDLSSQIYVH